MIDSSLISIIIPIFNVEKYLPRCLDSVINQTYSNIEIILVDDGSTDSSGEICDEYALKDSRITVIHKENGGVSSARNMGLAKAVGEWVLFVDADDFLPDDALDYYVRVVNDEDVDMVLGSYIECNDTGEIIYSNNEPFENKLSMLDCLKLFYSTNKDEFQGYIWNRLMKLSIIRDKSIQFNESIHFKEDGLFAVQYMVNCNLPCFISSKVVYHYYIHDNSSMRVYNSTISSKYLTNLDARILCLKSIESNYDDTELINKAKYSILLFYHQVLYRIRDSRKTNWRLRFSLFFKVLKAVGLSFSFHHDGLKFFRNVC